VCQNSVSYKSTKKIEYNILYFIIYIIYKKLYSTNMCITPVSSNSSNSSNSSVESVICYNMNLNNTIVATNTLASSPLLLYSCKYCSNNISKYRNIYRGFNHSFCSTYCRSNYSQKIALLDYNLNHYELWL
jgi:hypothetical protein